MAKINNKFGKLLLEKKITPTNILDGAQGVLDVAGLAPGIGAAADLANAGIYYLRGDYVKAASSAFSAIPGVGDAATIAKFANKGVKATRKIQGKAKKISEIDAQNPHKIKLKEIIDNIKKDLDDFANKRLDEMQEQLHLGKDPQIEIFNNLTKGLDKKIKDSQEILQNVQSQLGTYTKYSNTYGNIMKPQI